MTTQTEAERLAELLEQIDGQHWQVQDSAAAELRRLVSFNQQLMDEVARLQKREWVGLTDEEIDDIEATWEATQQWVSFRHATRVIESKLKEKNAK